MTDLYESRLTLLKALDPKGAAWQELANRILEQAQTVLVAGDSVIVEQSSTRKIQTREQEQRMLDMALKLNDWKQEGRHVIIDDTKPHGEKFEFDSSSLSVSDARRSYLAAARRILRGEK